jgi:hypothetical protein
MQRISTTVVGLVGERARLVAEALDRAANIRVELPDSAAPPLDRAVAAWQAATGTKAPYLVHDADPLALVADAWVRRYDQQGPAGELEVAVRDTLSRWRSQAIELPDYYVVLDAESWGATRRHWFLGCCTGPPRAGWFRSRAAPTRSRPASPPWPAAAGGRTWTGSWPTSTGSSPTGSDPTAYSSSSSLRA